MINLLKIILIGIVEGITEWLPISSTGHMILVDKFVKLDMTDAFKEMFLVVIQFGAILAVIFLFWNKVWPFSTKEKYFIKKESFSIWFKVAFACLPSALGFILDDFLEEHFGTPLTIAIMLIFYGILFIIIENWNKKRTPKYKTLADVTYASAFLIGVFQVLAMIPGTSRSGATIIGALLIGLSRTAATEFTFFLAIPTMIAASLYKLVKFGFDLTGYQIATLISGMAVAFAVSVFAIKFLMGYIKKHDFKAFGWYRIILGVIVILLLVF